MASPLLGIIAGLAAAASAASARPAAAPEERVPAEFSIALSTPFPNPKAAFLEAVRLIQRDSYSSGVSEEVVYFAALSGLLRHLSPDFNKDMMELRTPEVEKARSAAATGKSSSIGVGLAVEKGLLIISDVVPDSPADRAGLRVRDRIALIDGAQLGGKTLSEAEALLHRSSGTVIELTVERPDRAFDVKIRCEEVVAKDLRSSTVQGVGVLRVLRFSASGLAELDPELAKLKAKGVRGLVLDLRANAGGVVDVGTWTACAFLPKGTVVLHQVSRDLALRPRRCQADGDLATPLAVLVNQETASTAEVLASALQESRRALVVGTKTRGAAAIKEVKYLKNGYSFTLLTDILYGPGRRTWLGRGVVPDREVPLSPAELQAARLEADEAKRLERDPQLAAAAAALARPAAKE